MNVVTVEIRVVLPENTLWRIRLRLRAGLPRPRDRNLEIRREHHCMTGWDRHSS